MKGYKKRMMQEYYELKEKYDKLDKMLIKAEAGTLDFELSCPSGLLLQQKRIMGEYLHVLKVRAEIEEIEL